MEDERDVGILEEFMEKERQRNKALFYEGNPGWKSREWYQFAVTIENSDYSGPRYFMAPKKDIRGVMDRILEGEFSYNCFENLVETLDRKIRFNMCEEDLDGMIELKSGRIGSLEISATTPEEAEFILDRLGLPSKGL